MSAERHVRRWLTSNQTGCGFATMLAKAKGGIAMAPFHRPATVADIDTLFDFAAKDHRPAIAVLTSVRTELELVDQLLVLAAGDRWSVHRVPLPATLVTDDVLVGIEWRTADGSRCAPMGLAPFGTMPATRRAPYTCIAAWTGGHENRFRKRVDPVIHFLDVDLSRHRLDAEKYKERRKASEKGTAEILWDDNAGHYRNVAFRLSAAVRKALAGLPEAPAA